MCETTPLFQQPYLFDVTEPVMPTRPAAHGETPASKVLSSIWKQPALFDFEEPVRLDTETRLEVTLVSNGDELSLGTRPLTPATLGKLIVRVAA
jgi:hypothetical protein